MFSFLGLAGPTLFENLRILIEEPTGEHYRDFFGGLVVTALIVFAIIKIVNRIFRRKKKTPDVMPEAIDSGVGERAQLPEYSGDRREA